MSLQNYAKATSLLIHNNNHVYITITTQFNVHVKDLYRQHLKCVVTTKCFNNNNARVVTSKQFPLHDCDKDYA